MLPAHAISFAQTSVVEADAAKIIQQTQFPTSIGSPSGVIQTEQAKLDSSVREPIAINIPAGTPIEIEAAYTVSSINVKPGELMSFRVLIPVVIDGNIAIEKGALVTARITVAKRGGHWGKGGRLAWSMEDVVAADNTRVALTSETRVRVNETAMLKTKDKNTEIAHGESHVKGTSHRGEVATKTIIAAAIFPPLAPLALMHGFRRGENAVLPEGKRYVAFVRNVSSVTVQPKK